MKLYIKQKVFSFKDRFSVYDETGEEKYYVEGPAFSIGKQLHVYDNMGNEQVYIHSALISWLPKFIITIDGEDVASMNQDFSFFNHEFSIPELNWTISGNLLGHDYEIEDENRIIATISKKWFTFGDSYEISIDDDIEEIYPLAVVLVIDAVLDEEDNSILNDND